MTFFAQPSEPRPAPDIENSFKTKNYMGALLLIYPTSFQAQRETVNGPADVVIADLVVLDGPDSPQVHVAAWLWGVVLADQLKDSVDKGPVLARLGTKVTKSGRTAYQLETFTPEDAAVASAYLKAHPDPFAEPVTFTAPATASGLSAPGKTLGGAAVPEGMAPDDVQRLLAALAAQQTAVAAPPF
jgi:hypothetical protein